LVVDVIICTSTKGGGYSMEYRNNVGELHREDGPAVEYASGGRLWYINGKLHREDGPAIEYLNGSGEWFINGKHQQKNCQLQKLNNYLDTELR
jgi:hypothetical protein